MTHPNDEEQADNHVDVAEDLLTEINPFDGQRTAIDPTINNKIPPYNTGLAGSAGIETSITLDLGRWNPKLAGIPFTVKHLPLVFGGDPEVDMASSDKAAYQLSNQATFIGQQLAQYLGENEYLPGQAVQAAVNTTAHAPAQQYAPQENDGAQQGFRTVEFRYGTQEVPTESVLSKKDFQQAVTDMLGYTFMEKGWNIDPNAFVTMDDRAGQGKFGLPLHPGKGLIKKDHPLANRPFAKQGMFWVDFNGHASPTITFTKEFKDNIMAFAQPAQQAPAPAPQAQAYTQPASRPRQGGWGR